MTQLGGLFDQNRSSGNLQFGSAEAPTAPRETIIPPVLYLPVEITSEGRQRAHVHELVDGRRALLAYTALDRLADQCGFEQPWALVHTDALGQVKDEQPFDVVSFDPLIGDRLKSGGKLA